MKTNYRNDYYIWQPRSAFRRLLFSALWMALLALLFYSCDDFVEVDLPKNQLLTGGVFEEKGTANAAMTDVYSKIRDGGLLTGGTTGLSVSAGLYADELRYYGSSANTAINYHNNSLLPTGLDIAALWNSSYNQIYSANSIIEGVTNSKNLLQADRDQLKGEALFVRGLIHFYLTDVFGAVPYVKSTDLESNRIIGKIPTAQVYEEAIADLEAAIEFLPEEYVTPNRVRPNKYAAYGLLSRVYLYAGKYAESSNAASAVLNQTEMYANETDLTLTFKKESGSTLWQLSPKALNGNTLTASALIFLSGPPTFASLTDIQMNAFETGDNRKAMWTKTITNANGSWSHPFKYRQRTASTSTVEMSIILRLGEIYLVRAEARARAGELIGAKEDLDVIRTLAGLPGTTAVTQDDILLAILHERQVELFTEHGHRFFDLRRFGQLDAALSDFKTGWDTTDRLFPLPQVELNLNAKLLPQNDGY